MAAFNVAVDGCQIAAVSMDGHEYVIVRVDGQQTDADLAYLTLSGRTRPENGDPDLVTWVRNLPLRAGQLVTVTFLEHIASGDPAKTSADRLQELRDGALLDMLSDFLKDYRAEPRLRSKYSFQIASPAGIALQEETQAEDFGFFFDVSWHDRNPDRAEVSLGTYTIDDFEALEVGNDRFGETIYCGESVRFQVS